MPVTLPDYVCFRITRRCNARCGFCLAPAVGTAADDTLLRDRVDWLLCRGVRTFHVCGGEPAIHPALPDLLSYLHAKGAKTRMTSNGIEMSDELLAALRATDTHVKISLHGDAGHHNAMVGCDAFDATVRNLRRLLAARVPVSVQTTLVGEGAWVVDWMVEFCLQAGVRRLSLLPFLPRGRGAEQRKRYELTTSDRSALRNLVKQKRRLLSSRLDLRWIDLRTGGMHVVDVDGRIVVERGNEARDQFVVQIPS